MTEFHFLGALPTPLGILLVVVLAALAWWLYRREVFDFPKPYSWLLPTLRSLAIGLAVLMLLEPTLRYRYFEGTPTRLQVWVDSTESMQESDQRSTETKPAKSRYDRAIDAVTSGDSPQLEKWADQGEVVLGRFGGERTSLIWQSTLDQPNKLPTDFSAWGTSTWEQPTSLSYLLGREKRRIGSASALAKTGIDEAKDGKDKSKADKNEGADSEGNGQGSAIDTPILMFTDGQHNSGASPLELIANWPKDSAPLYIVGMGSSTPPEKVTLVKLDAPKQVFRTDRVQGTLQFQDGMKAGSRFAVGIYHEDELLWTEEYSSTGTGLRTESFGFSIDEHIAKLEAKLPNDQRATRVNLPLTAKVIPLENNSQGEVDSQLSCVIGVTARKQRILLLDSRSRWETRYLRNVLERDPQWEIDSYLIEVGKTPKWFSNVAEERPFPAEPVDFEKYDLIICGEIVPNGLNSEQLEHIRHAVERGGSGFIVIDGERGYWRSEELKTLSPLLPIEWIERESVSAEENWRPMPGSSVTGLGLLSLINGTDEENLEEWKKLPPFKMMVTTKQLPGSQVLATAELNGTSYPLFVTRNYGAGKVFYSASEETWRWRFEVADKVHQRFWNQVCRATMRAPFAVESEYLALDSGDSTYVPGQEIEIRARVKDSEGKPATLSMVEAIATLAGNKVAATNLDLQLDLPGVYRGKFSGLAPGDYEISLTIPGFSAEMNQLKTTFRVAAPPNPERLQLARNDALLAELAKGTGGRYVPEEQIEELWKEMGLRHNSKVVESDHLLWQSFWWFVPILALVGMEWWLRKKVGLI